MAELIILSGFANCEQKSDERCCQEALRSSHHAEETEVSTEEFDAVRSKILNLHSMWSIIIAKLQTKTKQSTEDM